uniref:Small ribosomal subunit protein uS7c n=1 Tax=Phacus orbicularis TaxID=158829 RepID=A0A182B0Y2_9EUGL|nr:ribosomal protein S7 [Phacus orbicularis]
MSRRKKSNKLDIKQDPIYNSKLVSMIINKILLKGKKNTAQYILYESMKKLKETTKKDPLDVLQKAILNVAPLIELKSKRVGGATYQIPIEIKQERGTSIALSILIKSARNRTGRSMISKLYLEILDSYNNIGNSVKKRDEIHKQAEANKAFASFKM